MSEVNHAQRAHALLSASGASRWLACPPSARFEDNFPESTSEFAEEGTLAHEVCEIVLSSELKKITTRKKQKELNRLSQNHLFSQEMLDYAVEYASYVQEKLSKLSVIEIEERLDFSEYVTEGFGTGDCIIISEGKITIIDFKYGKGVEVSAENNPQMMLYALGAIKSYSFMYDFETVEMCIYQPRIHNISEFSMSVTDLIKWGEETVKPTAQLAYEGGGEFTPGPHCKFCRGSAACKKLRDYTLEIVKEDFIDEDGGVHSNLMSWEDISEVLTRSPIIKSYLANVEEYALASALAGEKIPGYKVVEGRSVRVLTDADKVVDTLVDAGYDEALLYDRKLKSMTGLEKVVGKKKFNDLAGEYIMKPKGKPTLAVESDKRAEWSDANDDFDVLS